MPSANPFQQKGITLIEMVVGITLLSIASAAIIVVVSTLGRTKQDARDIAIGSMLLQACAEKVMAVREVRGFSTFATFTDCDSDLIDANKYGSFNQLVVTKVDAANGTCDSADAKCKVTITLQRSSVNYLQPLSFDVANF